MPFLIQIDAYDPVLAAPVVLRMASDDDAAVCHLNGQTWWPVIDRLPVLALDFYGGEFGKVTTPPATLALATEPWPEFARYIFADAQIQIWHGPDLAVWAGYTKRFDGRVTTQPVWEEGRAQIGFAVDDKWLDGPLLATYKGAGAAEGPAELKGAAKPLAIGAPQGVPGVLLDSIKSITQLSAYGAVEDIEVPLERLARQFEPAAADYANYAALAAATVAAGTWATCKAGGFVRMGAPPYGKLCFLMKGDKAGPDGWVRLPGAIIKRLCGVAGFAAKVNEASVDALDIARPYNLSLYFGSQITVRDAVQQIAASINAVAGVSLTGQLIVVPVQINAAQLTLNTDGSATPIVSQISSLGMAAPFWRLAIGALPFYDVHGPGDYATSQTPAAGADVTADSVATHNPASIVKTFTALFNGTLDSGQLPANFIIKRLRGTTDVSTSSTWTIENQGGISGVTITVTNGAVSIPTGATIPLSGTIKVKSVRDGFTLYTDIAYHRVDALAANTGGGTGGTTVNDATLNAVSNATSIVLSDTMTVKTGSAGTINFSGGLSLFADAATPIGTFNTSMQWKYRLKSTGGAYTNAGAAISSSQGAVVLFDSEISEYTSDEGYGDVMRQLTGLTANVDYEVELWGNRSGGANPKVVYFGGSIYAQGG